MYELEQDIRFTKASDVQDFVNEAVKCNFDIDLKVNHMLIDAKSILGVMSIGLMRTIRVCASGNSDRFSSVVQKYAVS